MYKQIKNSSKLESKQ